MSQPKSRFRSRSIEAEVVGMETKDGAGVSLTRFLHGRELQQRLDPFLMLDAFGSDDPQQYIAGFPDHPHRGFETITYMLEGRMLHRDSAGNEGLLESGDLQWMCAGSGVIHSEMPQQIDGRMEGFQLWLNLPAKDKLCAPWYQDIRGQSVPKVELADKTSVAVVAGTSYGVEGLMQRPSTEPFYLDVQQPAGATVSHQLPTEHNAFVLLYRGAIQIEDKQIKAPAMAVLTTELDTDGVRVLAQQDARYLLVAGKPLQEPIEQYGPFVMNSKNEIYQAINDFRNGLMG